MKKLYAYFTVSETFKKNLTILFLYALLAFALLSPTGSGEFIPTSQDSATHIAAIVQGKAAMEEGQFPLRTAPIEYHGWGYPKFQFYGPTLYFITSLLCSVVSPDNPYIAFKIILFLSFWLGGVFLYRLSLFFTNHFSAAVLAGFAYMAAPYFLIDAHWRYALAEVLGLGIVPLVLYYTLQLFINEQFSLKNWLFSSISWYCLMTIHLVTFVNTSFFTGLFILLLSGRYSLIPLCRVGTAYVWGCLLGAWFLIPLYSDSHYFYITRHLSETLMPHNWLTSLPRLFSITSLTPKHPHPGNMSGPFYPALGWPLLMGFIICVFGVFCGKMKPYTALISKLIGLFLLALFMTWSPINFWQYLPKLLSISQYSYRLLAEEMWISALLLGFALSFILEKRNSDWLIIPLGIWLIGLSSASWLTCAPQNTINVHTIMQHPFLGYHHTKEINYLVSTHANIKQSIVSPEVPVNDSKILCKRNHARIYCRLPSSFTGGLTQFPVFYYPHLLTVLADNQETSYVPTRFNKKSLLVGLYLSPGEHTIVFEFTGISWANTLSATIMIISSIIFIVLVLLKLRTKLRNKSN